MKRKTLCLSALLLFAFGAALVQASMVHSPSLYGLSARSIALGNASTALTKDVCLPYFNPAAMAMTSEGQIGISYLYAQPNFEGGPKSGSNEKFETSNKILSTGLIIALDELLKSNRMIAIGLNAALDDNGKAFINFDDFPHEDGLYTRYGESSFIFNLSLGFEIVEWFYFGGGVLTTLHSDADYYYDVDLAGRTDREAVLMEMDVNYSPIVSTFLRFDPVSIGLTYRGANHGEMGPVKTSAANTVGGSRLVDTPFKLFFKDTFVPENISLGIGFQATESFLIVLDGVWYHWGQFDEVMTEDSQSRDSVNFDMVDTYVPHVGGEYEMAENLFLRFGYSYNATPVRKPGSDGDYIIDNDRHVGSLGLGYDLELGILNYPLSIDAAFFHHYLAPTELESSDGSKFESEGNLSGGVGTLTLRF